MTTLLIPRPLSYLLAAIAMGLVLLTLAGMSFTPVQAAHQLAAHTYTVNSTADEPDADPANGVCSSTPSRKCTLRAAIMLANFATGPNTITVPAGVYHVTRVGYDDDGLVGDLDIKRDLTIQGAGSGATIVDGNGSVTHDRVFQILSTVQNVTLSGMTIRNGESVTRTIGVIGGGGLYMEGAGQLHLRDVIFDGNTGQNGGGIYTNFSSQGGSITMDNVILRANTATAGGVGAGGGMFAHLPSNLSQVVIRDSHVYSNTADGTGGGLYVDGNATTRWTIQRSEIYSNTAASGGGIGNFVPLALSDSRLHDNHVTFDGGAIEAFSPFAISRTTLDANTAGRFGGGIFGLQIGGNALYQEFAHIEESTLSRNFAQYGGGIYHDGFIINGSLMTLMNSTLSGNAVSRNGGGIYIYGGQAQLLNATVAGNRVQLGFPRPGPGIGGGLYITASATFTGENSLIANNARGNGITLDVPDDCFSSGTVGTLAYNLVFTTTNCFVSGPQGGNIVGQDPLLGPLQNNGGSTQTRALLPGSPAIDAGAPAGCTDDLGAPLTTDQRGWARPYPAGGLCDIGAYEYNPVPPNNTVEDNDIHVQYNGWRGVGDANANGGTYRISRVKNDKATFKFKGTSVKWVTYKGPDEGQALVTIDGVNKPVVDLYSLTPQWNVTQTYKGLANANHTITIKVLGTKNAKSTDFNVVVDAFIVGTTTTQDTVCAIQYDTWTCKANANASGGSYRYASATSSIAILAFMGDSISWIGEMGPNYGKAQVKIDGSVECPSPNQCWFDLYSATAKYGLLIKSFAGLGAGQHTIKITPLHTKNAKSTAYNVSVDAFNGPITTAGTSVQVEPQPEDTSSGDSSWLFWMLPFGIAGFVDLHRRS